MEKNRCFGNGKEFYALYHDNEWGVPSFDDRYLFEMLILEGAQAGLSWETVLKRREFYREAFHHFDVKKVASMSDEGLIELHQNGKIIRNRLKIFATRQNAKVFLSIQKEFGSFHKYLWGFVNHKPLIHHFHSFQEASPLIPECVALSKDLKKRGMTFVGPTIIYAYMQAVGLVNDHITSCWCYKR